MPDEPASSMTDFVQAAALKKCITIVATDRSASRIKLAKRLGATHTINNTTSDVVEEVLKITNGRGVHVSLDTAGVSKLAQQSWHLVSRPK
jgi:aryl-alcohol dehydrogenase